MAISILDLLNNSKSSFKSTTPTQTYTPLPQGQMTPMSSASLPTTYTPLPQRSLTPTAPTQTPARTLDPATIAAMSAQVTDMQKQASNLLAQRGIPDPLKNAVTAPVAQQPMPQQQMQQQEPQQDPMTTFNLALMNMLKEAQAGNATNTGDLTGKITGMQLEQQNRMMEPLSQDMIGASPSQIMNVRSAASGALDNEIVANMAKLKTNDARLANFVTALDKAELLGKDIKEMIVPSKEVIEGYKNAIIGGADLGQLLGKANQATRDAIMKAMNDSWDKVATAKDYENIKSVDGGLFDLNTNSWIVKGTGGEGGLTTYQRLAIKNQIADNARQSPEIKVFNDVRGAYEQGRMAASTKDGPGDLILLRTLAKVTDPTSAVREEEFRSFESAQGALAQKGISLTKGMINGTRLTDSARTAFMKQLESIYNQRKDAYTSTWEFWDQQAQDAGFAPGTVVPKYIAPDSNSQGGTRPPLSSFEGKGN